MYRITHTEPETGIESVMAETVTLEELAEVAKSLVSKPEAEEQIPGQGTLFDDLEG